MKNRRLCGGHGFCGYDRTNSIPRCFCDDGFTGDDCTSSGSFTQEGSAAVGLMVALLVLSLVLTGVILVMIKQVHGYRDDTSSYEQLHAAMEDDEHDSI